MRGGNDHGNDRDGASSITSFRSLSIPVAIIVGQTIIATGG